MDYAVSYREKCLRDAIKKRMSDSEKRKVANDYVDHYMQHPATEANFLKIANVLVSMQHQIWLDVSHCNPAASQSSPFGTPFGTPLGTPLGTGLACACDQYHNVETVPVAKGSKNVTEFQIQLWQCALSAFPVSSDWYYAPDGTSDSCIFVPADYRYAACFKALMGNVSQCGD